MNKLYTKAEKKKIIQLILIFIPFIKIDYLIYLVPSLSMFYNGTAIMISLCAAFKYLTSRRNAGLKLNRYFVFLIIFNISMIPFSVTEGMSSLYDVFEFYGSVIYRIAFCGMIAVGLKKNPRIVLTALAYLMSGIVLINILTVFLFPNGLYTTGSGLSLNKYWFLGYDNAHIVMYIFCIMLIGLVNYLNYGKVRSTWMIVVYLLCLFVMIKLWSATAVVSLLLLGLFIFLPAIFDKASPIFNIRTYIIVIAAVCTFIIVYATADDANSGLLSIILNTVLQKDTGFNSRNMIWGNYLRSIREHIIFGNGSEDAAILILKNGVNGAHNEWLQILYNGGVIHFIAYLAMLFTCAKSLWKYRKKGCARIVSISIFAMMVIQLMRGCPEIYWLSMYTIGYYISKIEARVKYVVLYKRKVSRMRRRVRTRV